MLELLRQKVCEANCSLPEHGLVTFTWGNVSAIDREKGLVVIKPSGVAYEKLTPENMVITDLAGNIVEGDLRPSSDLPTHLELYKAFEGIGGIVHTHSRYATAWAQSGRSIPAYGTTHADYFYGPVPCTRPMTGEEILGGSYEKETGTVIIDAFRERNPKEVPGALVYSHGPFSWGKDADEAVYHAVVIEEIAAMALITEQLGRDVPMQDELMEVHYQRKHGKNAYYGQVK